jgi:hypothetical protein
MRETDWTDRLRERLAAEGVSPSSHREAIEEIADHLNDLHRAAEREGRDPIAEVEGELLRMGSLAVAVTERARRKHSHTPSVDSWLSGVAADFRHAIRAILLNRSFSAIVVLTLAIGIGACTAVFSIVNALLLGSLPYPNPEQLVM